MLVLIGLGCGHVRIGGTISVELASATRFGAKETREIQKIVEKHHEMLTEAYHEYFAD